jgi:hypothetical protein
MMDQTASTVVTRALNYSVRCKQGSTNGKTGTCVNIRVSEPKEDKYGNILPYAGGRIGMIKTACKLLQIQVTNGFPERIKLHCVVTKRRSGWFMVKRDAPARIYHS